MTNHPNRRKLDFGLRVVSAADITSGRVRLLNDPETAELYATFAAQQIVERKETQRLRAAGKPWRQARRDAKASAQSVLPTAPMMQAAYNALMSGGSALDAIKAARAARE